MHATLIEQGSLLFLCHSIVPTSIRGLSDEHKKRETPRSLARRREKPSSHIAQEALRPRRLESNEMASVSH
jgi:hypothetical protein